MPRRSSRRRTGEGSDNHSKWLYLSAVKAKVDWWIRYMCVMIGHFATGYRCSLRLNVRICSTARSSLLLSLLQMLQIFLIGTKHVPLVEAWICLCPGVGFLMDCPCGGSSSSLSSSPFPFSSSSSSSSWSFSSSSPSVLFISSSSSLCLSLSLLPKVRRSSPYPYSGIHNILFEYCLATFFVPISQPCKISPGPLPNPSPSPSSPALDASVVMDVGDVP